MSRLQIRLLGPPGARRDDRPLAFRTRKALALLAYLAVEGAPQPRDALSALLWPESDAELGRASLRNTLAYLRAGLGEAEGDAPYLLATRDAISLAPGAPLDLDLDLVRRAAALRTGDTPREALLAALAAALDAYRGDFLAGFSPADAPEFDDWATLQREHWHRRSAELAERLVGLLAEGGEVARALDAARRWVGFDRLNEAAHRALIGLHLAAGDRPAALRAFDACRAALAGELGIAPAPETVALAERARAPSPAGVAAVPAKGPGGSTGDSPLAALGRAPLVGRAAEFGALVAAFESARRGRAGIVTLEGEPGIGKSRLARDFLGWAAARGATILAGQGFETGGRLPYQPLIDALRRVDLARLADALGGRTSADLGQLLPALGPPDAPPVAADAAAGRARLFEAVAALGRALAMDDPLVLHLDDLQWADAATLDLLAHIARRWAAEGVPALVVLGLRADGLALPDGARPALGAWLAAVARATPVTRLALAPLTAEATARLIAALAGEPWTADDGQPAPAGSPIAERLFAETSGQPFYLLEAIKALVAAGEATARRAAAGDWVFEFSAAPRASATGRISVPPGVRELIWGQLRQLDPPAFAVLAAGAVLGHRFDFAELAQVAGLDEDAALLALDRILAARLLREDQGDDSSYAFAHDRIRDVAYAEAGVARRRVFHRRALDARRGRGAPPAELARHAAAAGLALPAFRLMVAAGDAALRLFAVRDALAHYASARHALAALADDEVPPDERAALLLQLARAHELLGDFAQVRAACEEAIALARRAGAPALEWVALQRLMTLLILAGQGSIEEAITLVAAARREAEGRGERALDAEMTWSLAQLAFYGIDPPTARAHGERALALARAEGQRDLIARCLNVLAHAAIMGGRSVEGLALAGEARDHFAALGDRALEADSLGAVATSNLHLGHPAAALEAARAAVAICRAIDNPWGEVWATSHLARALLDNGEYGEAREAAARALALARGRDHTLMIDFAATVAGMVGRAVGALDEAEATLREALLSDERLSPGPYREAILGELAAACAERGDWAAAAAHARARLASGRVTFYTYGALARWHETAALLRAGEFAAAEGDLRRLAAAIGDHRRHLIPLHRARATLAAWRGDLAAALAELSEADALAAAIGLPGERWPILAALAGLHRRAGDDGRAGALVTEARAIVARLAATLPAGEARARFLAWADTALNAAR